MKIYPVFFTVISMVAGYFVLFQLTRYTEWTVDLETGKGGILKWYIDTGEGFSESEGGYSSVVGGSPQSVSVLLPTGAPRSIRLDPVDSEAMVALQSIHWREPLFGFSGTLSLEEAEWQNLSEMPMLNDEGLVLNTVEGVADIFGVWKNVPGRSLLWWRLIRIAGALIIGSFAFLLGTLWNHSIQRRLLTNAENRRSSISAESS